MEGQMTFEFAKRPTIKGYPELRWTGKRPYESTQCIILLNFVKDMARKPMAG